MNLGLNLGLGGTWGGGGFNNVVGFIGSAQSGPLLFAGSTQSGIISKENNL